MNSLASMLTTQVQERPLIPPEVESRLEQSLAKVVTWVQAHGYRAYEPADGNASPLFFLTRGHIVPMRVLQQVVLRAPINVRPFLGIKPHESAIARGYMAAGYLAMARRHMTAALLGEARTCLEWLIGNKAEAYTEFCWGDPYEYATRSGRRPLGEPLLIWSALIGGAFLDAVDVLGEARYQRIAESVGRWVLGLPAELTETGRCLSYVAYKQSSIHNSNAMGAAFLARLAKLTGDERALAVARDAMLYTCERQRADGSWFYAEDGKFRWIDNFHTGYILSALQSYRLASGDPSFDVSLERGLRFFRTSFFDAEGRPKYFHDRTYPVDIQCAAQAIETLTALSEVDPSALAQAVQIADWTVRRMQAPDGHFCYRDLGWRTVSTPMLHWGQATMVKALAILLNRAGTHA